MAGNSWDWTSSDIIATNGAERGKTVKAIRGGSWYAMLNSCRTNYRGEGRREKGSYSTVGFRIAVNADGSAEPEPQVSVVNNGKNADNKREKGNMRHNGTPRPRRR